MELKNKKKPKIPSKRELLKSLPNARREWNSRTPLERFFYFYGFGKVPADIIELPVFREREEQRNVHCTAYFYFVYAGITSILVLYTIVHHFNRGELEKSLPCTCCGSISMIGSAQVVVLLLTKPRFKLQSLIDFAGRYIYQNNHEITKYNRICLKQLDAMMRGHIIKMLLMFASFNAAVLGPIYANFTLGSKTTTVDVRVPFVEMRSNTEYVVNLMIMFLFATHGGLGYLMIEVFMSILTHVVTLTPHIIKYELTKLADEWQKGTISRLELVLRINNVLKQSLHADETLLAPISFTYGIAISIYCQFSGDFVAGYGWALMSWVQLYFLCDLGEKTRDNGLADALYDVEWEVFPPNIQKQIMLLINRTQNQGGMKMGPFSARLDRITFQIVTNKIFTFVMFLINFFG